MTKSWTPQQLLAIRTIDKDVCVSAGAGSGKTGVLTERFIHILKMSAIDQLNSLVTSKTNGLLVITFTNKATTEMRQRIAIRLEEEGMVDELRTLESAWISTIHSFASRLLKENPVEAGLDPDFRVILGSDSDSLFKIAFDNAVQQAFDDNSTEIVSFLKVYTQRLALEDYSTDPIRTLRDSVKRVMNKFKAAGIGLDKFQQNNKGVNVATKLKSVISRFSTPQKNISGEEEQCKMASDQFLQLMVLADASYSEAKANARVLDSEDLILRAVKLLENSPSVVQRYRNQFKHIFVDEFQDTDPMQYRLLQLLHIEGDRRFNVQFLVGDPQQSIYSFRNANPEILLSIYQQMANTDTGIAVKLDTNYRSHSDILNGINHLFSHLSRNGTVSHTPLIPSRNSEKNKEGIEIIVCRDEGRVRYFEMEISSICKRIHDLVNDEGFEYRDIAILLRYLTDVERYENGLASAGIPYFVVGGGRKYYARYEIRDLMNILKFIAHPMDDLALSAVLRSPFVGLSIDSSKMLADRAAKCNEPLFTSLKHFTRFDQLESKRACNFIEIVEQIWESEFSISISRQLEMLIAGTGYDLQMLARPAGRRRLANVRKLISMSIDLGLSTVEFIEWLSEHDRITDKEGDAPVEEEVANVVRIMTVHGAKGLEFKVVILVNMSQRTDRHDEESFVADLENGSIAVKLPNYKSNDYRQLEELKAKRNHEEELRVLYVAMTRAMEKLILCGSISNGKKRGVNWSDEVFPALGITVPDKKENREIGGTIIKVIPMIIPLR